MPRPTPALASTLALAALASLATARPAHAQYATPRLSVEGNALYGTVSGRDLEDLGDATGYDVQGRLGVQAFSLGVGYLRTTQSVSGPSSDLVMSGPFIEPRISLPFYYSSFTPYLTGRLARLNLSVDGDDLDTKATTVGGGLGVLVRLAPAIGLNLAGTYQSIRYKDSNSILGFGSGTSRGTSLDLRAGLSIGFGG